jgi:hypothetical protein
MTITNIDAILTMLFGELIDGADKAGGAFMLNSGDAGLLASLEKLSHTDASHAVHGGATIAAHAQHVRLGLSLMNRAAEEGGDPYSDPLDQEAWKVSTVTSTEWDEIRAGLHAEAQRWLANLSESRDANDAELSGMIASIVHVAYHFGAIRQIGAAARGPTKGIFNADHRR